MTGIKGTLADRGWTYGVTLPRGFKNVYKVDRRIEPDNSLYIENILADEYADAIYRSELVADWMSENQIEPLDFGGGVTAITIRMVADLPVDLIKKLKFWRHGTRRRITADIAEEIRRALDAALEMEP